MGLLDSDGTAIFGDVDGLPIYHVTRLVKQRIGDEVHLLKGEVVMGQLVWSHIEIWKVSDMLREATEVAGLALGLNEMRVIGHSRGH